MASPNLTPGPEACRTENDDPAGDLTRPDPRVRRRNRGEPDGVRTNTDRTGRLARCRVTVAGLQRLRADELCATQASLTKRGYRSKGRFSEIGVGDVVRPIEKVGVSLRLAVARLDRAGT